MALYCYTAYDTLIPFWRQALLLGKQKTQGKRFASGKRCRRWELNPHGRKAHCALNAARLPIPPLRLARVPCGTDIILHQMGLLSRATEFRLAYKDTAIDHPPLMDGAEAVEWVH
jgi:hypothetical protein